MLHSKSSLKVIVTGLISLISGCTDLPQIKYGNGAVPPWEGAGTYELADGFRMELIAGEPLIAGPVDMEIDEDGNMYVVEMPGYPLDKGHTGRVKLLKDTNGDGVMDKSLLFADGLMFPSGIVRWKKGVLVSDPPNILYLEDCDGDGISDLRDTLLTGFSLSNPHVNVNNPVYGLDNWVYLSHLGHIGTQKYEKEFGDLGKEVRYWKEEEGDIVLPKNADSRSVRFNPDTRGLELCSGKSQFGHTFDVWGHRLLTHNQNHIYHEVMQSRYLERNNSLLISGATENISDHGTAAEVFQITTHPDRQLFTPVGVTTSSSGITAYTGGLFGPEYNDRVVFVAESVSNLVHADVLLEKGATFGAARLWEDREFMASRDSWARPVNMYIGPDGGLYVLDYYRRIIEHPEWMSDEAVKAGGLYDGHNMGRIYRVVPEGAGKADWTSGLDLGSKPGEELADYLSHPNSWWRTHAQRMLVERSEERVIKKLEEMVKAAESRYGRLHALWTLEGMQALKEEVLALALEDKEAGVRENAIRVAEKRIMQGKSSGIETVLYRLEKDPDEKVRFQLLCTLGYVNSPEAQRISEAILFRDIEDKWIQIAALSSDHLEKERLLDKVLREYKENEGYATLVRYLTEMIGKEGDPLRICHMIHRLTRLDAGINGTRETSVLGGLISGLKRREQEIECLKEDRERLMGVFFNHSSSQIKDHSLELLKMTAGDDLQDAFTAGYLEKAMAIGEDKTLPSAVRAKTLGFLALANGKGFQQRLNDLVVPEEYPQVQRAALEILDKVPGPEVSQYILEKWGTMTHEVRETSLNTFLSEEARVKLLLDAVEQGTINRAAIGWTRTVTLMNNGNEELRKRARRLLTRDDSEEVNKGYKVSLTLNGDVERGRAVFKAQCAGCHQVRGEIGVSYGPDLGTIHNWLPKDILANVLNPGLSIAPGFDLWEVKLTDGSYIQGMIASETSSAMELSQGPGVTRTISRSEIDELRSLPMSMMPGFGGIIDHQEMADLITFLRHSHKE